MVIKWIIITIYNNYDGDDYDYDYDCDDYAHGDEYDCDDNSGSADGAFHKKA